MAKLSAKELLEKVIELVRKDGKGMTLFIALSDELGTCSTVKVAHELMDEQPEHAANAIVILASNYYQHFIAPEVDVNRFAVDAKTGKKFPEGGGSTH